jgi:hypothetical protein
MKQSPIMVSAGLRLWPLRKRDGRGAIAQTAPVKGSQVQRSHWVALALFPRLQRRMAKLA